METAAVLVARATRPLDPPPDRGRLLEPAEVAREIFHGKVGRRWIIAHAPRGYRIRLGNKFCYYESDMQAWAESLREHGGTA